MNDNRFQWKIKRISKKIKLKDIARHVNVSDAMICMHEKNERNLSYDKERQYKDFIENYAG